MKRESKEKIYFSILVLLFILLIAITIYYKTEKDILLAPGDPYISEISPNIIYNSQSNDVVIEGNDFTPIFSLNAIVEGTSFPLDTGTYNIQWISGEEIKLVFPSGTPQIIGEISITNNLGVESNRYPFEIKSGIAPPNPTVAQVTPINLQNPFRSPFLNVKVWGNNFDTNSKVILDGVDMTSRVLSRNDKKIEFYLTDVEAKVGKQVRVDNNGNVRSNKFNINETSIKYPDLIRLTDSIVNQGDIIEVFGHNFFSSNSKLYIDDIYVGPSDYTLSQTSRGNFIIRLNSNNYGLGVHKIYFDNPPRYPNINYDRLKSNKLYFEIKNAASPDTILENDNIKITFDGDSGSIEKIENKETGYSYDIKNDFPWRMILRKLNSTSLLSRDNPIDNSITNPDQDLFNPFKGNCNDVQFSINNYVNFQVLSVTWPGCQIDQHNNFDFVQKFHLEDDKPYFEMNFSMENVNVLNYSVSSVLVYTTILDDPSVDEAAIIVDRVHETVRNPGFNILTRGSRNLCPGFFQPLTEGQIPCGALGQDSLISYADMGTDGEGVRTSAPSWLDFWMGYWNQNGDYIYGIALDNFTYTKGYSYQGEEGAFKNSAWIYYPNNFYSENFNYKIPYAFRIGIGKGTTFIGDETWINIADKFKEIQQSKGMIKTPFELRNLSDHVVHLDVNTYTSLGGEFFENVGGVLQIRLNPNIAEIVNTYEESRKFYGAEESTLFVWGGDQDDTQGYGKFVPIPGVSYPFYEQMNNAGWNSCFYSLNAGFWVRGDEPDLPEMIADGELAEFDPVGTPIILPPGASLNKDSFAILSSGSIGLAETDNSYLKWFLGKYRVMNNDRRGTRCVYSDGIFTANSWANAGPRSIKYGYEGYDDKAFTSQREFFKKEYEELIKIDPETYSFHEGASQLTTNEDLFPFQPASSAGASPQFGLAGTTYENEQKTQFYQRVYGGYIDFILSNEIVDPNKLNLIHIPDSYLPVLKAIPGVPQDYNKTLVESYLLPGWVGFLYKSAVPIYVEVGIGVNSNYTPIYRLSDVPEESEYKGIFDYWVDPLEEYAKLTRELVNARQLARNYFHGLWHLPIPTNSPEEEYYYIADWTLFLEADKNGAVPAKFPRVINSVRQSLVGNDWGQKFGLMFINTYAREPTQTVDFTFEFDRYGLIPGQNYNLFKYSKENGREYIRTVNNNFQYTVTIPSRKFVLYELEIDGDGDLDGVTELNDICPNTVSGVIVNPLNGCPIPRTLEFSSSLTTNLGEVSNLLKTDNFVVGINNIGKINYSGQEIRLLRFNNKNETFDALDIERAIEISYNKIGVNADDYPELNQTAYVTFYNLSYSSAPVPVIVTSSGNITCPTSKCSVISYDVSKGELVMQVVGFSNYSTVNSTCGDNYCHALSETCSTCSADCGTCSSGSGGGSGGSGGSSGGTGGTTLVTQCNDGIDNDGDGLVDYPADPGCLNALDNSELDIPILGVNNSVQGNETNEIDLRKENSRIRVVFWLAIIILVTGIVIVTIILVRVLMSKKNKNKLFEEEFPGKINQSF